MSALAVITTILRVLLEPGLANEVGAHAAGRADLAHEVELICRRESWGCRSIGVHVGHVARRPAAVFKAAARRSGALDASCLANDLDAAEWGPRGPHGHVPAHALRYLPRCTPPSALDVPAVSAYVAAMRLAELESRYRRRTAKSRSHAWRHGVGCRCAEFESSGGIAP